VQFSYQLLTLSFNIFMVDILALGSSMVRMENRVAAIQPDL